MKTWAGAKFVVSWIQTQMVTEVMTAKHFTHVTRPWSTYRALVSFIRYL